MDQNLYRKIILEHNESAFHFERPDTFDVELNAQNQSCGDSFDIFLSIKKDPDTGASYIEDIHFTGSGCAVSKAATSILVKNIYRKSTQEARLILEDYINAMNSDTTLQITPTELSVFLPFRDKPSRKECCLFSASCILKYLKQ